MLFEHLQHSNRISAPDSKAASLTTAQSKDTRYHAASPYCCLTYRLAMSCEVRQQAPLLLAGPAAVEHRTHQQVE